MMERALRRFRAAGLVSCSLLVAVAAAPRAAAQGTLAGRPYVDVVVDGPDFFLRPERVRYRVIADPGTYVSVFLITPTGRVSLQNPYEAAVIGTHRRELPREASTGIAAGEAYIVAIATRSSAHHLELVKRTRNETRLAARYQTAEASFDELVQTAMRATGNELSVAYASFRLLWADFPEVFAYSRDCRAVSIFSLGRLPLQARYGSAIPLLPLSYAPGTRAGFLTYSELLNREAICAGQTPEELALFARAPAPSTPNVPRDTAMSGDGVPKLRPPFGATPPVRFEPNPRGGDTQPESFGAASLRTDPVLTPTVPVEPVTPIIRPVQPVPATPVTVPVVDAPRVVPVPVQIDRPISQPVSPPPTPVVQPVSPPPPPPPPVSSSPRPDTSVPPPL